jgi:hypothetical protein
MSLRYRSSIPTTLGPSFIGDPDMGFSSLRMFGPQLIHHTQLKVRSNIAIKNFMIIDSPGMIDSPVVRNSPYSSAGAVASIDRGYDFETVCKWYAQRADVILLFFDPDKPGWRAMSSCQLVHANA